MLPARKNERRMHYPIIGPDTHNLTDTPRRPRAGEWVCVGIVPGASFTLWVYFRPRTSLVLRVMTVSPMNKK